MDLGASSSQPQGPLRDELWAAKYRHEAIAAVMRIDFDKGLQVMAHRREREPFVGKWALPSGPLEVDETIEQSIRRHINVPVNFMEQLSTRSALDRDPYDRTVATAHVGLVAWNQLSDASFVCLGQVWAFDHGDIVADVLARLRGERYYDD